MSRQTSILNSLFSIFLMVAFFASSAAPARAFFLDEEISAGNLLTAGAVSLGVEVGEWSDPVVAADLGDGETASQTVLVDTSLVVSDRPVEYRLEFDQTTIGLCPDLFVVAERNGAQVATGQLGDISPVVPVGSGGLDTWQMSISPLGGQSSSGGTCELRYRFSAYVADLGHRAGFFDEQTAQSFVSSSGFGQSSPDGNSDDNQNEHSGSGSTEGSGGGASSGGGTSAAGGGGTTDPNPDPVPNPAPTTTMTGIVLNEVAADAVAEWDSQLSGNEWIEIYNTGTEVVDLNGWLISEYSGTTEKFYAIKDAPETNDGDVLYTKEPGTTISPGHFRVVIFTKGNKLNNNFRGDLGWAEKVSLYAPFDHTDEDLERPDPLDSMEFEEAVDERSDGRVPDGTGAWQKTERTPLTPNIAKPVVDADNV